MMLLRSRNVSPIRSTMKTMQTGTTVQVFAIYNAKKENVNTNSHLMKQKPATLARKNKTKARGRGFVDYCLSTSARNSIERPGSRASSSAASRISSVASHRNRLSGCSSDRTGAGFVGVSHLRACASVRFKSQNKKVSITVILFKQKPAENQSETTRLFNYCSSTSARNSIERPASRASSSAASRISSVASHRNR